MNAPAASIDEVIAKLKATITSSVATQDRVGYFAALYNRVTESVQAGIERGVFDDNDRMRRLDVVFANRYLAALEAFRTGGRPSASWQAAFEAARVDDLPPIVHLILGMTAHIGLDLGVAAAAVAPGAAIQSLKADFEKINDVLGSLLDTVKSENGIIDPVIAEIAAVGGAFEDRSANEAMNQVRGLAWSFAIELAELDASERDQRIARRDEETAAVIRTLLRAKPLLHLLAWHEKGTVASQIALLAEGEGIPALTVD